MVRLSHLFKSYRLAPDSPEQVVLQDVSLSLNEGESVAIMGPSGCGKSTLLNIMGTLDAPDRGEVELFGKDVTALDDAALSALRAEQLGFVFQMHHLLPQLTVLENVMVPVLAKPRVADQAKALARAEALLARVGLAGEMAKRPAQLSGGERQRAAVVRALIREPKLILADEPTGALDAENAATLADLLLELHRELGTALVVVTHDESLAGRMSRRLRLHAGKVQL
jgi:lipoprotein-releasing system ATP-binding protein